MLPFVISCLLCSVSALILGTFALFSNYKSNLNRAWFKFNIAIFVWSFSLAGVVTSTTYKNALIWQYLLDFAAVWITPFFLIFIITLININNDVKKRISITSYILGVLLCILSITPYFKKGFATTMGFNYWLIPGNLYFLFPLTYLIMIIYAFNIIKNNYIKQTPNKKIKMRYIAIATAIGFTGGFTNFFPQFTKIYPFGNYLVIVYITLSTYAIVKHRLMDIRVLVVKSVVYTLIVSSVAVIYISIILYAQSSYYGLIDKNILFIAAGFATVFGFQPLRRGLEKITDKIFFKDHYNFRELLADISNILSTRLHLEDLTKTTIEKLIQEMRLTKGAIVITNSPRVSEVKSLGFSRSKVIWNKVTAFTLDRSKLLVADELPEDSLEKSLLRDIGAKVVIPLRTENEMVGVLALGEKRSGDMFNSTDLKLLEIIAPQTAISLENAVLFQEKEQRIKELDALNKLALHVGSTLHLDKILDSVLKEAIDVTGAEAGSIMLLDNEGETLSIKTAEGIPKKLIRKKVKVGEGIAGIVAKTERPLNIDGQNKRFKPFIKREELSSSLSVPLKVRDKLIGVLNVNRRKKRVPFTDENLHLITSFAAQAAEAIENANLYEDLERTFIDTISALAAAVDAKDHYTFGHSEAVTRYSTAIAEKLKLSVGEIKIIKIAAKLHDIGKIGINEAILNKPDKLTNDERKLIEMHPKIGIDILKNIESLKDIIPLILYHHERLDGGGYPSGITGQNIPLGAKIITVADSFHAMRSDRPYRKALPLSVCIEELKKNSGAQFDPEIVDCFIDIINNNKSKKHQIKIAAD